MYDLKDINENPVHNYASFSNSPKRPYSRLKRIHLKAKNIDGYATSNENRFEKTPSRNMVIFELILLGQSKC